MVECSQLDYQEKEEMRHCVQNKQIYAEYRNKQFARTIYAYSMKIKMCIERRERCIGK
jgi:hypothetical protein